MATKTMLHVCCAPDATVPIPALLQEGYKLEASFWGANIHPEQEYKLRRSSVEKVCLQYSVPLHVMPYASQVDLWLQKTHLHANEPERGKRCRLCFAIQLLLSAEQAVRQQCSALCTTLTISPHKDPTYINSVGQRIADKHGLEWIHKVWRKGNGFLLSVQESKRIGLYRQNYCGCLYSIKKD